MPLIYVKLIEDVFTPAQKKEIIARLTDAMVSIEGEDMRPLTWVVLEEVKSGDWGMGGRAMTADAVKAPRPPLAHGRSRRGARFGFPRSKTAAVSGRSSKRA